ncbi:NAD-dependent epimerase/dehydratase family protein [Pseudomonas aeruginosa]|uniref:NAD-dependent epimerase/dehydratase family protein n=1 Tax=Pseudomonas aeruginosa TaxID=287 RepID=UPI004046FAD6
MSNILLCGATGFVGSAIYRSFLNHGLQPKLLLRKPPSKRDTTPLTILGDITNPKSLTGCCEGVDVLVHAASVVSDDEAICQAINTNGTQYLLAEAQRAGVSRIIYISTAAVYGNGTHSNIHEGELQPAPVSATSRSRYQAELSVIEHGGIVLRPFLIYGIGDRWFIPALVKLLRTFPVMIEKGDARLSLLSADDLAECVALLTLAPKKSFSQNIYHVSPEKSVKVREVIYMLHQHGLIPLPSRDLTFTQALDSFRSSGDFLERQLSLIAFDHVYDARALKNVIGILPRNFNDRFDDYIEPYSEELGRPYIKNLKDNL